MIEVDMNKDTNFRDKTNYALHRETLLFGDIDESKVAGIIKEIKSNMEENPQKDIYLLINTHGGDWHAAISLYQYVKCKKNIHTVAMGVVKSSGILVFMGGTKRFSADNNSLYMIHHSVIDIHEANCKKIETKLAYMNTINKKEARILDSNMWSKEDLEKIINSTEDSYFEHKKAIELNLVTQDEFYLCGNMDY